MAEDRLPPTDAGPATRAGPVIASRAGPNPKSSLALASPALSPPEWVRNSCVEPGWPDHAVEPFVALSAASPRGPRGRLSGRSIARRRAPLQAAGRPALARGPGTSRGARRSGPGPARAARGAGTPPPRADGVPILAGGALGCGLRDRRVASPGHTTPGIIQARGPPVFDGMIASVGHSFSPGASISGRPVRLQGERRNPPPTEAGHD